VLTCDAGLDRAALAIAIESDQQSRPSKSPDRRNGPGDRNHGSSGTVPGGGNHASLGIKS
jgi:hypothetical protein